jgi:hypothetical protein
VEIEAGHPSDAEGPLGATSEAAVALAVGRAETDPSTAAGIAKFLRKQTQFIGVQMENLHEQRLLQTRYLKRRELNDRLKLTLQFLGVAAGVGIALIIVAMIVDAARSESLVIEPIAAPADLQAQGLTPGVLSAQLLDKLRAMQVRTDSARAGNTYAGANGDDIKLEIPTTGVSIGELLRVLRARLGHDVHITAETFHRQAGLVLTARVGDFPGQSFEGAPTDLDSMMQRAAEGIFAETQPYRYSVFLSQTGKAPEAMEVLRQATQRGPRSERAWAYIGLGGQLGAMSRMREAEAATRRGLALDANLAAGWNLMASISQSLGHDEQALAAAQATGERLKRRDRGGVTGKAKAQDMISARAITAELKGDFRRGAEIRAQAMLLDGYQFIGAGHGVEAAIDEVFAHQRLAPTAVALSDDDLETPIYRARLLAAEGWASGDWARVLPAIEQIQAAAATAPDAGDRALLWPVEVWPWEAYGYARSGRMAEAQALIARTPLDCYLCLRMRGEIAALTRDRRGVDAWFGRAVRIAPSLPFGYGEWGRAVDRLGDPVRAAELFKNARARGPAWPDPLAWQGQSQLRQGQVMKAKASFQAATRLAPAWREPQAGNGAASARLGVAP